MRIRTASLVAPLAAAMLAMLAPSASAEPQLLTPAAGATSNSSRPQFTWTLDEGQDTIALRISTAATVGDDGVLKYPTGPNASMVSYYPSATKGESLTSFTPLRDRALEAGTYYWQLQVYDHDQAYVSPVRSFRVAKRTLFRTLSAGAKARGQRVSIGLGHTANAKRIRYSLSFKRGNRKIGSTATGTIYNDRSVGSPAREALAFRPIGFTLKRGERYTVTAKITASGITRTRTKTFTVQR